MKIDIVRSFFRWYLGGKATYQENIKIDEIKTILVMSNTAIGDTLFFALRQLDLSKKIIQKKELSLFLILKIIYYLIIIQI